MRKQKKESSSSSFVLVRCFVVVKALAFKTPPLPVDEGTNDDEIERHPPPNVVKVVKVVISLSMSSSVVERGFRVRVLFRKVGKKRGGFLSKMFRVYVCVCFIFIFLGSPEGEKKIRFFYSFCRDKKIRLFFL